MKKKINPLIAITVLLAALVIVLQLIILCSQIPDNNLVNQTENWQTYSNSEVGFSLQYPLNVIIRETLPTITNLTLDIDFNKIELLNAPMGFNREISLEDRQALSEGEYGYEWVDLPTAGSRVVVNLGNKYAKSFTVIRRLEVCDIVFERRLIFYNNDYQVVMTLSGVKDEIISSMPQYFTTDEANCEKIKVWDNEKMDDFYLTLVNHNGSEIAQDWYNTFDNIIKTINIVN